MPLYGPNQLPLLASSVWVSGTTSPLVTWDPTWRGLVFAYHIGGYNGGTPVGRLLLGTVAAAISTTAANNGQQIAEGNSVAPTTTAVSIPGCPFATTLSAIARSGELWFKGESGSLKTYHYEGANGAVSVATPGRTMVRGTGAFSDLGTNLLINQAQLGVYDTLTATALSAQTFIAGTRLDVFGLYQ